MTQFESFIHYLENDADTRHEIRTRMIEQLVEIGAHHGFEFTTEDVRDFFPGGSLKKILAEARGEADWA